VISTYDRNNPIFEKGYLPPPRKKKAMQFRTIGTPEGYLRGLPPSKKNVKRVALKTISTGKLK